jgi:hypothetical protein
MRYIRYILDLPWWAGLPIALFGNLLVPFGLFWYGIGLMVFLFGCWTFSKLLKEDPHADSGRAIICIPIIALIMWFLNEPFVNQMFVCSFGTLFVLRLVGGMFFGLIGFQGFRK